MEGVSIIRTLLPALAFAGDEIEFTRKVGEFATEELVAKRKKD